QVPEWLLCSKVGFLALFFGLCIIWKKVQPLRPYAFVMLIFFLAITGSEWVRDTEWWAGLINETTPSFALAYIRPFIRDIGVTLVVILALWIIKHRRSEFFLVRGQLNAQIEPIPWLGIRAGESWRKFGWIFALIAALVVSIPTMLVLQPSANEFAKVIFLLPFVLLYAAINALNEEVYFRLTLLSTLPQIIGKTHALLINVAFFGLAHYLYGSPPGMIGLLMTGFLAWLLGKSILETKGIFWAWFIHFLPDVVIFASYALLWVKE
ncbi:CPBP family intramembrane metalloprotease, partial [bacterium]|nr:CPBP family intramembrane metalloprotease [bacterium]